MTFTAAASGNPSPTVQWQNSTDGGSTWSDISGATSTTYTITSVTSSDIGNEFRAVFTNANGSATTNAATLDPPTTSVLIPSNGTTLSGSTYLDAASSNATSVKFLLFGGIYGYNAPVLCTATPTEYGWLCSWNTSTAPNGSYVSGVAGLQRIWKLVQFGRRYYDQQPNHEHPHPQEWRDALGIDHPGCLCLERHRRGFPTLRRLLRL